MLEDAAARRVPEILKAETLRRLLGDAIEHAPRAAAMHRFRIRVMARLGADQHARDVTQTAETLMKAPRRSRRAALAVRSREMRDLHAARRSTRSARVKSG